MYQELPSLLQSYELRGKQPFVSDFGLLLRHAIEKGRGPILYSKKNPGTSWGADTMKQIGNSIMKREKHRLVQYIQGKNETSLKINDLRFLNLDCLDPEE